MLRKFKGWTFAVAASEIDAIIGTVDAHPWPSTKTADRLEMLKRLLEWSLAPQLVVDYLHSRGLSITSTVLPGHRALYHREAGRRVPAVVAPVLDIGGGLQSVMRIFLADVAPKKKLTTAVTTVRGAAVHLYDAAPVMGVAEGIETALAVRELFGLPVWAALSANGIAAFQPPPECQILRIFADNDASGTGQDAAAACARRWLDAGREVTRLTPKMIGADFNDIIRNGSAA